MMGDRDSGEKEIVSLLKEILEELKKIKLLIENTNTLLQRQLQNTGLLGDDNKNKVVDFLQKNKRITKQQLISLLDCSETTAVNIMKKMGNSYNMYYSAGIGAQHSFLLLASNRFEELAVQLAKLVPRKQQRKLDEIVELLGIGQNELMLFIRTVRELFPDFKIDSGWVIRMKK